MITAAADVPGITAGVWFAISLMRQAKVSWMPLDYIFWHFPVKDKFITDGDMAISNL